MSLLVETAQKMTAIIQKVLDRLSPAARARKLKTYLSKRRGDEMNKGKERRQP